MNSPHPLPVALFFPMEFEAEKVWKKMRGATRIENGFLTKRGDWRGAPVVSARIGMGHTGLVEKITAWLESHPCRAVLLAGLAGALDPAWEEGDLSSFQAENWDEFQHWTGGRTDIRPGQWHTAHEIIDTGEAKLALGKRTGCGIVEMEWDYVAEACGKLRIPCVGLRAVSDHANKPLPTDLFLLGCDRETGKSTPLKIALHLALRPWRLWELLPAVAGCTYAREVMSNAVVDFLDGLSRRRQGSAI